MSDAIQTLRQRRVALTTGINGLDDLREHLDEAKARVEDIKTSIADHERAVCEIDAALGALGDG